MRILLLTPWYAPFIHPRAHRWTALAEHWAAEGHEVSVVSAWYPGMPDLSQQNGVRIYRRGYFGLKEVYYHVFGTRQARGRVGQAPAQPNWFRRMLYLFYLRVWRALYFPDDALFWLPPARRLADRLVRKWAPDLLITVSLPFSAHLAGLQLKRRYPNVHWLADVGDPFSFQSPPLVTPLLYGRLARQREAMVLAVADTVSVTCNATLEEYLRRFGNGLSEKIRVIPPLLHPAREEHCPNRLAGSLNIGYFGSLYLHLRLPDPILDWLSHICSVRPDVVLHWYGEVPPEFYEQLVRNPHIRLYGLRARAEVRAAMAQMDVLLHLGNRSTFQLPSKAVDYLAAGRPVLHFSFVEEDPFTAFWPCPEDLFILALQPGKPDLERLKSSLRFVEAARKRQIVRQDSILAPFRVEAIGAAYLDAVK